MNVINSLSIPFATLKNGDNICLNLNLRSCANGFVSGRVGSGKTNLLRSIASNALSMYLGEQLNVWCVSFKTNEFSDLQQNHSHALKTILAVTEQDIRSFLLMLKNEGSYRCRLLRERGYVSYVESTRLHIPRLLILIDDYGFLDTLLKKDDILKFQFEDLLTTSRACGISFVLADQASIRFQQGLSLRAQNNFSALIALSSANSNIAEDLLLSTADVQNKIEVPAIPGELIYKNYLVNDLLNRFELISDMAQFCPLGK